MYYILIYISQVGYCFCNQPYSSTRTNLSSSDLEEKYVQDPFGGIVFATDSNKYILDFKTMIQKNLDSNAQRCAQRRPSFSLPEEKTDDMR